MKKTRLAESPWALGVAILIGAVGIASLAVSLKLFGTLNTVDLLAIPYFTIPLLVVLALAALMGRFSSLNGGKGQLLRGVKLGWYLPVAGIILTVISFFLLQAPLAAPSVTMLISFLIAIPIGAAFEEVLCRGLIQNIIMERAKYSGRSPWWAILVSAAIFGLLHFSNLYSSPYLIIGTTSQVIYTFVVGVALGVVYYLTNNLTAVIVLHTLFNWFASLELLYVALAPGGSAPAADIPLFGAAIQLLVICPAYLFARWTYRRQDNVSK